MGVNNYQLPVISYQDNFLLDTTDEIADETFKKDWSSGILAVTALQCLAYVQAERQALENPSLGLFLSIPKTGKPVINLRYWLNWGFTDEEIKQMRRDDISNKRYKELYKEREKMYIPTYYSENDDSYFYLVDLNEIFKEKNESQFEKAESYTTDYYSISQNYEFKFVNGTGTKAVRDSLLGITNDYPVYFGQYQINEKKEHWETLLDDEITENKTVAELLEDYKYKLIEEPITLPEPIYQDDEEITEDEEPSEPEEPEEEKGGWKEDNRPKTKTEEETITVYDDDYRTDFEVWEVTYKLFDKKQWQDVGIEKGEYVNWKDEDLPSEEKPDGLTRNETVSIEKYIREEYSGGEKVVEGNKLEDCEDEKGKEKSDYDDEPFTGKYYKCERQDLEDRYLKIKDESGDIRFVKDSRIMGEVEKDIPIFLPLGNRSKFEDGYIWFVGDEIKIDDKYYIDSVEVPKDGFWYKPKKYGDNEFSITPTHSKVDGEYFEGFSNWSGEIGDDLFLDFANNATPIEDGYALLSRGLFKKITGDAEYSLFSDLQADEMFKAKTVKEVRFGEYEETDRRLIDSYTEYKDDDSGGGGDGGGGDGDGGDGGEPTEPEEPEEPPEEEEEEKDEKDCFHNDFLNGKIPIKNRNGSDWNKRRWHTIND